MKNIKLDVQKLAKNATILIVDDSRVSLEMYRLMLNEMFTDTYTARNGKEAYDLWLEKGKDIDIILTDMMMPVMDGTELITKIREKSNSQRIMVLSGLENLNEMRDVINLGIDGIMMKPFKEEKVFPILLRVLSMVKAKRMLKQQHLQLQFLSKENIELKTKVLQKDSTNVEEVDIIEKAPQDVPKESKYNIRHSFKKDNEKTEDFYDSLGYERMDFVDRIQHDLEDMEAKLFRLHKEDDISNLKETILNSSNIFKSIGIFMDELKNFEVATDSVYHLIDYLENCDFSKMKDREKKDLFLEIYISIFEDTQKWLEIVFIDNDRENINYFDASFANSCLELESIFSEDINEDDCELEFF